MDEESWKYARRKYKWSSIVKNAFQKTFLFDNYQDMIVAGIADFIISQKNDISSTVVINFIKRAIDKKVTEKLKVKIMF